MSGTEDIVSNITLVTNTTKTEHKKKDYYRRIEIFTNTATNILTRYRNIKNPVMRHMMLIDKFYLLLDIGLGTMETIDDIPPELKQKLDKLISDIKKDLSDLSNWVIESNNSNNGKDDNLENTDIYSNLRKKFTKK